MIIAANFKTNHTRESTRGYMLTLQQFLSEHPSSQQVFVFPPATALDAFEGAATVGAQNAYAVESGAFTGEIGLQQLSEFGIDTVLIGHSERRHIMGESQGEIAEKFAFFKSHGFTVIYCIGEPEEVREEGNDALMEYLDSQFDGIDLNYAKLIVAYEPVWAIGSGETPSPSDIELIHGALRQQCARPLLYGGSVKAVNAAEILSLRNVDGILVGSGALKVEDFCEMIAQAQAIEKGEN